jgi:hypothetical protein
MNHVPLGGKVEITVATSVPPPALAEVGLGKNLGVQRCLIVTVSCQVHASVCGVPSFTRPFFSLFCVDDKNPPTKQTPMILFDSWVDSPGNEVDKARAVKKE